MPAPRDPQADLLDDLLDGGAQHVPLGLYPQGPRPIDAADMASRQPAPVRQAHLAGFCLDTPTAGHWVGFAAYDLSGSAPRERHFGSWPEMVDMWRRKGMRLGAREADPHAAIRARPSSRRVSDAEGSPLALTWGLRPVGRAKGVFDEPRMREVARAELEAGLLALMAEGWMLVPLGRFPLGDTLAESIEPGVERYELAQSAPAPFGSRAPAPRL